VRLQSTGQDMPNIGQVKLDVAAPPFSYAGGAGNNSLTVDLSGGSPFPAQGVGFDGGADADMIAVVGNLDGVVDPDDYANISFHDPDPSAWGTPTGTSTTTGHQRRRLRPDRLRVNAGPIYCKLIFHKCLRQSQRAS
jgi:hypothetical protein